MNINKNKQIEKKEALNKAKQAKKILKEQKKERKIQEKQHYAELKLDKKINKNNKKLLNKERQILENNKTRINYKNDPSIKTKIKEIIQLNKSSKGERRIPNSRKDVLLEVKNLNKIYPLDSDIFYALKDVNLEIKKGEFVVILGPSGSGKTTLLNVISGLDRATTGDVIVNGDNLSAFRYSELTRFRRNNVGFIFQSYNLLPSLNASDNVEIGRNLQNNASRRLSINDVFQEIGMKDSIKKKVYQLSGGQQQRISIARAISKNPILLIGDEPTGALDQKTSLQVLKLFRDFNKNEKTTIILVTHNTNIAKLADKIIHIFDSKIKRTEINSKPWTIQQLANDIGVKLD